MNFTPASLHRFKDLEPMLIRASLPYFDTIDKSRLIFTAFLKYFASQMAEWNLYGGVGLCKLDRPKIQAFH